MYRKNHQRKKNFLTNPGQTLTEYIILLGIIAIVAMTMAPLLKRGIQSIIKVTSDQLAMQNESEQRFGDEDAHLQESFAISRIAQNKETRETMGGITQYLYSDHEESYSNAFTNLGFTNNVY